MTGGAGGSVFKGAVTSCPDYFYSFGVQKIFAISLSGTCGKPEDIPHAEVNGSSYNFEDTLTYTCEKGYRLNGPETRTCLQDEKWSSGPTCTRKSFY